MGIRVKTVIIALAAALPAAAGEIPPAQAETTSAAAGADASPAGAATAKAADTTAPASAPQAAAPRLSDLAFFQQAAARHPRDTAILTQLGYLYLEAGDNPRAGDSFVEALKQDPSSYEARKGRGVALYRSGAYREAEGELLQAVQLDQDPVGARYWLGMTYEKLGMTDQALLQYQAGLGVHSPSTAK